jgi:spore coat protein U-like protein
MRAWVIGWLGALACWTMAGSPAEAANNCGGLGVGCYCNVSVANVSFGTYNPFAAGANETTGDVVVECGAILAVDMSYAVKLSAGGGAFAARRMASGADLLNYQLYTDTNRTQVWGDGTASTAFISLAYGLALLSSRTDHIAVYARAPAGQNVKPGTYTDTITVRVDF